jgi:hypothetical protein
MKREKRLTKRERKAADGGGGGHTHDHQHIHCIACGRHLDPGEFADSPPTAKIIACQHGSKFPVCATCVDQGQKLLDEHDRTGQPVKSAGAWH